MEFEHTWVLRKMKMAKGAHELHDCAQEGVDASSDSVILWGYQASLRPEKPLFLEEKLQMAEKAVCDVTVSFS